MLTATLLETPDTAQYLKQGQPVSMVFKETEVSLAKGLVGEISLRNRFAVTVNRIERGDIMSAVHLSYGTSDGASDGTQSLTSVITTRGLNRLQLSIGDQIEALVKANEIALMELKDGEQ